MVDLTIINAIHHSQTSGGWHFQTAFQLSKLGGVEAEVVHPRKGMRNARVRESKGIRVHELPSTVLRMRCGLNLKFVEFTPAFPGYLLKIFKDLRRMGREPVLLLHGYRNYNSDRILRKLSSRIPIAVQHHGSFPTFLKFFHRIKHPSKAIHRISPFYYFLKSRSDNHKEKKLFSDVRLFRVLNNLEKHYLNNILKLKGTVIIGTMGIDLDKIKKLRKDKEKIKKELNLLKNGKTLIYLGNIPDFAKGSDLIPRISKKIKKTRKINMVMAGFIKDPRFADYAKSQGITVLDRLPHTTALKYLAASDACILPARSPYYFGGMGVAPLEAMALGVPVVSPSLIHLPQKSDVRKAGICTPWCDNDDGLKQFTDSINNVLNGSLHFNGEKVVEQYYSWKVIIPELVGKLKTIL